MCMHSDFSLWQRKRVQQLQTTDERNVWRLHFCALLQPIAAFAAALACAADAAAHHAAPIQAVLLAAAISCLAAGAEAGRCCHSHNSMGILPAPAGPCSATPAAAQAAAGHAQQQRRHAATLQQQCSAAESPAGQSAAGLAGRLCWQVPKHNRGVFGGATVWCCSWLARGCCV